VTYTILPTLQALVLANRPPPEAILQIDVSKSPVDDQTPETMASILASDPT
jgi:hypothetical protein